MRGNLTSSSPRTPTRLPQLAKAGQRGAPLLQPLRMQASRDTNSTNDGRRNCPSDEFANDSEPASWGGYVTGR